MARGTTCTELAELVGQLPSRGPIRKFGTLPGGLTTMTTGLTAADQLQLRPPLPLPLSLPSPLLPPPPP
jgi:hypothetical protein